MGSEANGSSSAERQECMMDGGQMAITRMKTHLKVPLILLLMVPVCGCLIWIRIQMSAPMWRQKIMQLCPPCWGSLQNLHKQTMVLCMGKKTNLMFDPSQFSIMERGPLS